MKKVQRNIQRAAFFQQALQIQKDCSLFFIISEHDTLYEDLLSNDKNHKKNDCKFVKY